MLKGSIGRPQEPVYPRTLSRRGSADRKKKETTDGNAVQKKISKKSFNLCPNNSFPEQHIIRPKKNSKLIKTAKHPKPKLIGAKKAIDPFISEVLQCSAIMAKLHMHRRQQQNFAPESKLQNAAQIDAGWPKGDQQYFLTEQQKAPQNGTEIRFFLLKSSIYDQSNSPQGMKGPRIPIEPQNELKNQSLDIVHPKSPLEGYNTYKLATPIQTPQINWAQETTYPIDQSYIVQKQTLASSQKKEEAYGQTKKNQTNQKKSSFRIKIERVGSRKLTNLTNLDQLLDASNAKYYKCAEDSETTKRSLFSTEKDRENLFPMRLHESRRESIECQIDTSLLALKQTRKTISGVPSEKDSSNQESDLKERQKQSVKFCQSVNWREGEKQLEECLCEADLKTVATTYSNINLLRLGVSNTISRSCKESQLPQLSKYGSCYEDSTAKSRKMYATIGESYLNLYDSRSETLYHNRDPQSSLKRKNITQAQCRLEDYLLEDGLQSKKGNLVLRKNSRDSYKRSIHCDSPSQELRRRPGSNEKHDGSNSLYHSLSKKGDPKWNSQFHKIDQPTGPRPSLHGLTRNYCYL